MNYRIKTVSMLMKCLTVDIPIYREISGVNLRITRVVLFQKSLLELWSDLGAGIYSTLLAKDTIDAAYKMAQDAKKPVTYEV